MPLPPGLTLNRDTGLITGVPTAPGTYSYTLIVRDAQGSSRQIPVTHEVHPYNMPALSGAPGIYATRGVPYSAQFVVTGGTEPFTWSISSGTLPGGLALDGDGLISGTPDEEGGYTNRALVVRLVDVAGSAVQFAYTLRYRDALSTSYTYPAASQNSPYSATPVVVGGHEPLAFSVTDGSMPAGLSFDPTTGRIYGTPISVGSIALAVQVTDVTGATASISQTFTVNEEYTPVSLSGGMAGTSKTYQRASGVETISPTSTLTASGGSGSITYSWERLSGSTKISASATTSPSTGFTSTAGPGENVSAVFRLTATDGVTSATYDVTISANNTYAAPVLSGSPPIYATRNKAYSGAFTLAGGKAPFSYSLTGGTLPTGITLNASTGQISGTPTDGSYTSRTLTIRVTDADGVQDSASYTMQYRAALTLTGSAADGYTTSPYSWTPTRGGGHSPYSYSITSGSLPAGLSMSSSTGAITGTPTTAATASFTIRVTDADGNTASLSVSLKVNAYTMPTIFGTLTNYATRTKAYSSGLAGADGLPPFTYSIYSGSLPPGLSLNGSNGNVTGTPSSTSYGSYTVRIQATDSIGNSAVSASQSINYRDVPTMVGRTFAPKHRTDTISESVATSANTHTPVTYSIIDGNLPAGATLNTSTGLISGTLTGTSYVTHSVRIQATDGAGNSENAVYQLPYANVVSISVDATISGTVGVAFSSGASAGGGFTPRVFSISAGSLPPGLSLNTSTGSVTGTPTTAGTYNYTIRVTDTTGAWAQQAVTNTISSGATVSLSNAMQSATADPMFGATAELGFVGNLVRGWNNGTANTKYTWISSGTGSGYEVRATLASGSAPVGPLGTWTALGGTVSWSLDRIVTGTQTTTLTIEVRPTGGSVIASATFTLSCTVF